MFHHLFERTNCFYENSFAKYGRFLAKHHVIFILGAFLLNIFLSAGMLRLRMITDSDTLFMPQDSQARLDEHLVKLLFNESTKMTPDFFLHQILDLGTWAEVNFQTCDLEDNNILREPYLLLINRLHLSLLEKTFAILVTNLNDQNTKTENITFEKVCARRNGKCLIDGSDLLNRSFYERWLKDAMQRKQRFYEEHSIFNKSASSIANEFRFFIKFENSKPSITDLTYNLGKSFYVNAVNESKNETEFAYAQGLKLRYNLNSDYQNATKIVKLWELAFLNELKTLAATSNENDCILFENQYKLRISFATSQSLDLEMAANIALDSNLITGTFVLIMVFACLLMSINSNCVSSPGFMLPMMGILSAMFGVSSSFGLMSLIGFDGCNLIFVIPFLVIGIGIDDMFIIYSTYMSCYQHKLKEYSNKSCLTENMKLTDDMDVSKINKKIVSEEKEIVSDLIAKTLSKSAVSITITSLTDFFAFLVGMTTNFKSVQIFCVYAGFAILFCYLYQITFFCGFLCLHIRRILKKRNAYLFCFKQTVFDKINICNTFICCKNLPVLEIENYKVQNLVELGQKEDKTTVVVENLILNQEAFNKNNSLDSNKNQYSSSMENSKLQIFFKQFFRILICTKKGKAFGTIFFVLYLCLSIFSASKIREGINLADLVAENSYYSKYTMDNSKLTDLTPIVMFVVYEPIDYDNIQIRMKLKNLIIDAYKIDGIKKNFNLNWLSSFGNRKINYKYNLTNLFSKLKDFPPYLNDLIVQRCEKIELPRNQTSKCEIVKYDPVLAEDEENDYDEENYPSSKVNQNTNKINLRYQYEIVASRFYVQYSQIEFSSSDAKPMHLLRKLCVESKLPILPYSITFKFYEQFEQTLPNILQAFLIAVEAMYLIALIFIPDLVSVFCIIAAMGSILVGLVGLMNFWSLTLSSVTMIELIMSVGFCVDFSAHICHAFIAKSGCGNRSQRAYKACLNVGIPIFNSALSTIIGLSLLAFCNSYIFISFFKTMTILMVLGVINSLIFLPILLSIIGPHWPRHEINKSVSRHLNEQLETTQNL